jgi:uncharacterized protein (TIGR02147 family)
MHLYQKKLNDEYERRFRANKSYSLRAFARDLEIPAPKLSQYLNNTCGLSTNKATEIANKLKLSKFDKETFILSVEAAHSRNKSLKHKAQKKLESYNFKKLTSKQNIVYNNWKALAIVRAMYLKQFSSDVSWISENLKIPKDEVIPLLNFLENIQVIEKKNNKWQPSISSTTIVTTDDAGQNDTVFKIFKEQQDVSNKIIKEHANSDDYDYGSSFLYIDDMEKYQEILSRFLNELFSLSDSSKKNSLYAFTISMVPIIKGASK